MNIARLADLGDPACTPRLVIKVGSALLVGRDGQPRRAWLEGLANEIVQARKRGQDVIVVSSGAIALGAARLGLEKGGRKSLSDAQAAAAVGQIALGGLWSELLGACKIPAAQLLVTLEDLDDRRRYLNASATLGRLLKAGAVPVVNENDSIATAEIRFGDNDRLAARVGQAGQAAAVVLLSDVDGLYDRDPGEEGAQFVPLVRGITTKIRAMASGRSSSGMGSGGMVSKLQAAAIAERAGIALAIVDGRHDAPIARALVEEHGTLFLPRRKDVGRKAWLGGRERMKGTIVVDEGCVRALRDGKSLLAAGILEIEGAFKRGAPVVVQEADGTPLAKGLVEYDSAEIALIMGSRSSSHEASLGYAPRSAVIHRNQLVML